MTRAIMIDLETVGSVPGCGIVSIGAAACTDDGFVTDRLYVIVSRESCRGYGLFEQQGTLEWWAQQPEEARKVLDLAGSPETSVSLPAALEALNGFVRRHGRDVEIYGNGSEFDNAILAAAAHAAHVELAWAFWQNRCYRTLKSRAPHVTLRREGTHHNALDDACSQAEHLGRINRALAPDSDTMAHALLFIGWMADRYQERSMRRLFGIRFRTLPREAAVELARLTFDELPLDTPFGGPGMLWNRDDADALVDEEMRRWKAAE
jgi:hypothetical protein|nr:3'-5' exoribonuclease [uncultured Sphingomonas sp.]